MTFKQELLLSIQRALLGNVSSNVKAIALGFQEKESLHIIYYVDALPTSEDYETVNDVIGEILSDFPMSTFKVTQGECRVYNKVPIKDLESLDAWVYVRKDE